MRLWRVVAGVCVCLAGAAGAQEPVRPKITGISHVGYFVSDLPKALEFWQGFLGFEEYFSLPKGIPSGAKAPPVARRVDAPAEAGPQQSFRVARIVFLRVNDHQHIELVNEAPAHPPSMLSHIAFTVDDAAAMKAYLRAKGVEVAAGAVGKTKAGDLAFEVKDPDGTVLEFVQVLPDGVERKTAGASEPAARISTKIYHLGFLVGSSVRAIAFYHDVLGFEETWRGTSNPAQLSWINMRVPDGSDYVEFMLYSGAPSGWGGKNHIAMSVPDVAKAVTELQSRAGFATYGKPLKAAVGINQKRQLNLFDPDGTRVELMEESTITGKPTPSSTAPPPVNP